MKIDKKEISNWFLHLQKQITNALEITDGKVKFQKDYWQRIGGGGGKTKIIQNGNIIEKGGVNFSEVYGTLPENIQKALNLKKNQFYATGISIVIHPINPWVPIIHMNNRYFEIENETWWFGGGIDLTPHYIDIEDAKHFHSTLKNVCDKTDSSFYNEHKNWADDYFFIKHRNELRGIGGTFFDRLNEDSTNLSKKQIFEYVQNTGKMFAPTYISYMKKHGNKKFYENQKQWQFLRRGRYVEFNLVYDKGTKFGLETDGRVESILMSLPKLASWEYNFQVKKDSMEYKTQKMLKKGIDWINF